jgi:hypothetical protein
MVGKPLDVLSQPARVKLFNSGHYLGVQGPSSIG